MESRFHQGGENKMSDHQANLSGLPFFKGFIHRLALFFVPSQEDLLKAGVYLDERYDRLMVLGEGLHEEVRRSNDERSDLLFTK